MGGPTKAVVEGLRGKDYEVAAGLLTIESQLPVGWHAPFLKGGEGYAMPVSLTHNGERAPYVCKGFLDNTLVRQRRTTFLVGMRLWDLTGVSFFRGAPRFTLRHLFRHGEHELRAWGHLAQLVEGESLGDLFDLGAWQPTVHVRTAVAHQLCMAVEIMESAGLAHGDLYPLNVSLAGHETGEPKVFLIDFDGFNHRDVPALPFGPGRGWGMDGYRAHYTRHGDETSVVDSDRFALAVLLMEVMTRKADESELLEQRAIDRRGAMPPAHTRERWPAGAELLTRTLLAERASEAVSPREWRQAIAEVDETQFAARLSAVAATTVEGWRVVVQPYGEPRAVQTLSGAGNGAALGMPWLEFRVEGDSIQLGGEVPPQNGRPQYLMVRDAEPGARLERYGGRIELAVRKGAVAHLGDIKLNF